MESEILCTPNGDSLIITDKILQQQEKEDACVAQKIQAECDKKFIEASEVHDSNEDDVISKAESVETTEASEKHARVEGNDNKVEDEPVMNGNGVPHMQNGNHHEEEAEGKKIENVEPDVVIDSLNMSNGEESELAHAQPEAKVAIVDAIEKEEEKPEEQAEVTPEIEQRPISPAKEEEVEQEEIVQQKVEEVNIENGECEVAESCDDEPVKTLKVETAENDNEEVDTVETKTESVKIIEENCHVEEEPVKGLYQPEKIECFGISVKEMVNDMPRVIEDEMKAPKESVPNGPRKGAIATSMDTESVREAYNDIRADQSDTTWAVFKYEASRIICSAKGVAFDEFKKQFDEDERAYGYIRLQTGDEMSKRHKFLFVTWIGPGVSVLKRAKMSIDKAIIKNVVSNFAVELQLETLSEFDLPFFIESLNKASGANYGTGVREI